MDFTPLVLFGIVLIRVGTIVAMTPIFGTSWAPAQVKVGLSAILAIALMPFVPVQQVATPAALTLVVVHEAVIGLAIASSVRILVGAAEFGGYLVGFQLGFAYAAVVDPQSGVRNNVLAALYGSLAMLVLFGTDVHHQVIRLLLASYDTVPVAVATGIHGSLVETVTRMLGLVIVVGAQLAAPVVLALLLVELVMGVITRAAPSLNLATVGAPLRLLVGLTALATAIQVVPGVVARTAGWGVELGARLALAFR